VGEARVGFHALLAAAWDGEGNVAKATESLLAAAQTLELTLDDVRVEEMLTSYLGVWNMYFDALIETFLKQGRIADAFNVSERARARAFLQLIGNHRIQPGRGADAALVREAEALRTQIAEWESMPASAGARNVRNDLREAQSRYAALLTRLKLSTSEYAALTTIRLATAAEIQSELPPGTALVSYYATRSGLHAWVLDRSAIHHVRLHTGAATLAQAACWAERIGRRRGVTPAGDPGCAQVSPEELHRELFAPLEEMIATRRLVIVPHGALHYVPFAALRNGRTGRYLIEDFTLMYAPSASALRFLRGKESPVDGTAMVLGDPGERLPFAQREAIQVAAALRISPLLGGRAMESRFYGLDGMTDLVHVAAHGTYDADHPLFSQISLAAGEGRDGNLEVHEILGEVDLSGVNLVVLAACDTGVGKSSRGDDVVGFTRAFLYAGTPGVLAALWKIPDDATAALMEEFYCLLLAGESVADALRGAQLALLHGGRFTRPEQWAAFALYGDPRGRWASASPAAGNTRSPQDGQ
jgi:CHAT domain-containing protein